MTKKQVTIELIFGLEDLQNGTNFTRLELTRARQNVK